MAYELEAAIISAVAALTGACVGGLIGWKATNGTNKLQKFIAKEHIRNQRLAFIDASLPRIGEISIEHPFFG